GGAVVGGGVGFSRAEHGVVVEHHGAIKPADVERKIVTRRGNAKQTNDPGRGGVLERAAHDAGHAGAFHQNIRLHDSHVGELANVKGRAEVAHDLPLRSTIIMV